MTGYPSKSGRYPSKPGRRVHACLRLAPLATAAAVTAVLAAVPAQAEASAIPHTAGTITTVAGGVGGPGLATTVSISFPCYVSYTGGKLYIGDESVRAVSTTTDQLTTPAGTGLGHGPLGDRKPATKARIDACGATVDHSGNLVIADRSDTRVRVVAASTGTFYGQSMTAGDIYTVAGIGTRGLSGDGGPATAAELDQVLDVQVDAAGNLVVTDSGRPAFGGKPGFPAVVRVVAASSGTFYGQSMTAGDIYTVAGATTLGGPAAGRGPAITGGLATKAAFGPALGDVRLDSSGNLLIADASKNNVRVVPVASGTFYGQAMKAGNVYTVAGNGTAGFSGDGGQATSAELNQVSGVSADPAGNLLLADRVNNRIRVVAVASGTFYGRAMAAGDIYTVAGNGTAGFSGDRGPAAAASLNDPQSVTADGHGNLVISDSGNSRIRVVAVASGTFYRKSMTAGDIYTVAGEGKVSARPVPALRAQIGPEGVAEDQSGNLLITDNEGYLRVLASSSGTFYGQSMTAGDLYAIAGNGNFGFSGDGGPATEAEFGFAAGVAVDSAGNVLVADENNERVRVIAVHTGTSYGQAMTAGDIYTIAGDGDSGFSGDGGPATSASLSLPQGVAVDAAGNVLIADSEASRVRVVAEHTGTFYGQAMTAGHIYTIAGTSGSGSLGLGGPAISAHLSELNGVALDAAGNVLIGDTLQGRILVVAKASGTFYGQSMTAGDIYDVAGNGTNGFFGDGGPATAAELEFPDGAVADAAGNLLIADTDGSRVRVVAASTGTFYGVPMTAGDIYTIAGNGACSFAGDGGPAVKAAICGPVSLTTDAAGDVLIADAVNARVRMISG
jgi:hypothetical protein